MRWLTPPRAPSPQGEGVHVAPSLPRPAPFANVALHGFDVGGERVELLLALEQIGAARRQLRAHAGRALHRVGEFRGMGGGERTRPGRRGGPVEPRRNADRRVRTDEMRPRASRRHALLAWSRASSSPTRPRRKSARSWSSALGGNIEAAGLREACRRARDDLPSRPDRALRTGCVRNSMRLGCPSPAKASLSMRLAHSGRCPARARGCRSRSSPARSGRWARPCCFATQPE